MGKLFLLFVFALAVLAREDFLSHVLNELIEERLAEKYTESQLAGCGCLGRPGCCGCNGVKCRGPPPKPSCPPFCVTGNVDFRCRCTRCSGNCTPYDDSNSFGRRN